MSNHAKLGMLSSPFLQKSIVIGVGNIVARGLGFLFPIILTWLLTQESYGYYRYIIATSILIGQMAFSGYPTALTRYLGKYTKDTAKRALYFSNICFANVALLLIIMLVLIPLLVFLNRFNWEIVLVLVGLMIDYTFFAILRGYLLSAELAIYAISSKVLQIALLIFGYYLFSGISPQFALAVFSFANLLPLFCILGRIPFGIRLKPNLVSFNLIWEVTKFTAPLLVNAIAYGALVGFGSFLIRSHHGLEAVAIYDAALTLTVVFSFVPFAINTILMPTIARSGSWRASWKYIKFSLYACGLTSIGLIGFFVVFGESITGLVFPSEYFGVSRIVVWLAVGSALFYLYSVLSQTWIGLGKPQIPAVILSVSALINVIINFLLVPRDATGAALAFICSSLFGLIAISLTTRYRYGRYQVTPQE